MPGPARAVPADRAPRPSTTSTSSKLLGTGHLYPCFCTPEELEAERQAAQAEKRAWVYSGRCRALPAEEVERRQAAGEPFTLRMHVPPGKTVFHDLLRGAVEFDNDTIGDFIVQRSDGTVTYNLAVVVDDVTMEITHVIRGDDHISNTPKQVVIYEALGAAVPEFLHMPLLFGTDKKKLSKRHGATKLEQLTAMGYLVEVVRNYLCFLSTEFDESMITWSLDDLVEKFDVLKLGTSASIFDPEKLRWMNGRFIRAAERRGARRARSSSTSRGSGSTATRPASRSSRPQGPQALAAVVEGAETAHRCRAVPPDGGAGGAHPRGRAARAREDRRARRLHPDGRLVLPAAGLHGGGARAAGRHGGGGGDAARAAAAGLARAGRSGT